MTVNDPITSANQRALEVVTSVQESILDATKSYLAAVAGATPAASTWPTPTALEVPDTKDLIEETFRFQTRMLEVNRSFALSLTELLAQSAPASTAP